MKTLQRVNFRTFTPGEIDDFARDCASNIRKTRTHGYPNNSQLKQMAKELMMCEKIINGETVTSMLVYSDRLFNYMKKCPIITNHKKQ